MNGAKKILGVFSLLLVTCVATSAMSPYFLTAYNLENLLRRTSLFGVISIGAAFVIIVGGIDLSIGSVVALVGCLLPWMLVEHGVSIWLAVPGVLGLGLVLGLLGSRTEVVRRRAPGANRSRSARPSGSHRRRRVRSVQGTARSASRPTTSI